MRRAKKFIHRVPVAALIRGGRRRISYLLATPQARRHSLSGPVGQLHAWKLKRDYQIAFLKRRDCGRSTTFWRSAVGPCLEIGCGTLRGGLPIIDFLQEGHYWGIDASEIRLEEARKELAESGLEHKRPTLQLSADLSEVMLGRRFEFIWAFAVLPHLEDDLLRSALV